MRWQTVLTDSGGRWSRYTGFSRAIGLLVSWEGGLWESLTPLQTGEEKAPDTWEGWAGCGTSTPQVPA